MTTALRQFIVAQQALLLGLITLIVIPITEGCIFLPIPTPEYGEGFSESQVEATLARKPFTRIDTLLTFGEPLLRKDEDRFFIYRWDRSHWSYVMIFVVPWGGAGIGGGDAVYHQHYLAMEFNSMGELQRYKYIGRWIAPSYYEFTYRIFPEWVNEQSGDSQ